MQVSFKVEKRKRVACYSSHGGDSAQLRRRGISWSLWLKPSSLHAWWPAEESLRGVVKGGEERYRLSASSTWQRGTLSFCRSMRLDVSTSNKYLWGLQTLLCVAGMGNSSFLFLISWCHPWWQASVRLDAQKTAPSNKLESAAMVTPNDEPTWTSDLVFCSWDLPEKCLELRFKLPSRTSNWRC